MAEKTDQMNCSICLSDFKRPKILECFHTFCEACLGDYISKFGKDGQFQCPLCRQTIKVPESGASQFAGNMYVTDNFSETDVTPEKPPSCDVCKKDVDSEFRCKDCNKFLCSSCKTTHDSFAESFSSKHEVVCLSDKTETEETKERVPIICQQHGKKFAVFCMNCAVVVCSKCFRRDHSTHDVQNISDIGDLVDKGKADLEDINVTFKKKLTELSEYRQAVEGQIQCLQKAADRACSDVDKKVREGFKTIKNRSEQLKHEIRNSIHIDEFKLNQKVDETNRLIRELESRSQQLSDDVVKYDSVDVLTILPELKEELDDVERELLIVPTVRTPKLKHDMLNETNVFQQIGLDTLNEETTINFSFGKDEFIKLSARYTSTCSTKFVLNNCTFYLAMRKSNNCLQVDIKSVDGEPPPTTTLTLINKEKTKSELGHLHASSNPLNYYCAFANITVDILTDKSKGFIDIYNKFTLRLTQP